MVRVLAVTPIPDEQPYTLLSYDTLETLPAKNGQTESMFDNKGIGKGATRAKEQVIFFSMGIPSVGAMRQRGHHPVYWWEGRISMTQVFLKKTLFLNETPLSLRLS